jgi:predicted permease
VWRRLDPRRSIQGDVRDEIAFHIEGRVRELVARGWDEDAARARVLARFGDVRSVEEACRGYDAQRADGEVRGMRIESWVRDVRLAARGMARSPAFTAVVVLTLAVGIGASTSVFSVVEGVLLRPLPFADPDRLVAVWENDRATGTTRENASPSDYYDFVARARGFEGLAQYSLTTRVLTRPGSDPVRLNTAQVSRDLLEVLGIDLQVGRMFTAEEDLPGGPEVVILTDALWRAAYEADPGMVGRALSIDGTPLTVVGVLPRGVRYPTNETDIWVPIRLTPATATRSNHWVSVVGRLAPATTLRAAQAEMTRIMAELEAEFPGDNANRGVFVERLSDVGRGDVRATLWVLFASVLTVLAIGCVNVINLLLARGAGRSREVAVHVALGASVGELRRRFCVEGALLTGAAGIMGLGLAVMGMEVLTATAPARLVQLGAPELNGVVLGFTVVVSALIGLGFGLLPAYQARRVDIQAELKDGRTSQRRGARMRVRRALVSTQLALAVVLLVGATLLIRTLHHLQSVDPGFRSANVLRMDFSLPESRYPRDFSRWPDWHEVNGFNRGLIEAVESLPGARAAAVVTNHPLDRGFTNSFRIEGQAYDPEQGEISTRLVTPGYFETVGLRVLEGRLPEPSDGAQDPHVIVLNRRAVERYFPQGGALGSRVGFWGALREVVGIVENERIYGLAEEAPPALYVNLLQSPPVATKITLMVRTEGPPLDMADPVRRTLLGLDRDLAVFNVSTMDDTLADASARERFASWVLGLFAGLALLLAVLGVHGVLAYLVAQRGHEVGVRMALGATRGSVVMGVIRQGAGMALPGVLAGVGGALAVSRIIRGLLVGVSPTEPGVYVAVGFGLFLVAVLASALPAYRAATLHPASTLRGD